MERHLPIKAFVSTPRGLSPLSKETAILPLPQGLNVDAPTLAYGPYLQALTAFVAQDDYLPLRVALSATLSRSVKTEDISWVEIISEKHGALYNVARIRAHMADGACRSFALNSVVSHARETLLDKEYDLLHYLHERFKRPFLPRPFFKGCAVYEGGEGENLPFSAFMAEWFDEFHEFHLSERSPGEPAAIKVWDRPNGGFFLSSEQTRKLYEQGAALLTTYFDVDAFKQIYPWHHAAGDFVIALKGEEVDLRLITVRGHQSLFEASGGSPEEQLIAVVHFFLNLSFRMRLDRLDGVGALAPAPPEHIGSIVEGFLQAWGDKALEAPHLPSAADILQLLRSFSSDEWLSLAELAILEAALDEEELLFAQALLKEHATALHQALQDASDHLTALR